MPSVHNPGFHRKKRRNPNDFSWQLFSDDEMTALRASDLAAEVTRNGAPLNVIADGRQAAFDLGMDPKSVVDEGSSRDMQDQALRAKFSNVAKVLPSTGSVMQEFADAVVATREVNSIGNIEAVARGFQRGASRLFSNAWYNSQLMASRSASTGVEALRDVLYKPKKPAGEDSAPVRDESTVERRKKIARVVFDKVFNLSEEEIEDRISYLRDEQTDLLEDLVFARDHADRRHERHKATIRMQEEMSKFNSQTLLESLSNHIGLFARNPGSMFQWAFETLAESATPIVIGAAAAGATAPLSLPVSGAVIAGTISATGSYTQARASMEEELTLRYGYDLRTRAGRAALVADPDFVRETYSKSFRYGAVIGLMDGASHGVASRTLIPDIVEKYKFIGKTGVVHGVANGLLHSAAQGVMGGGGEALGLLAAEEDLDWDRVVQEAIPDFLSGAPGAVFYGGFDGYKGVQRARKTARLLRDVEVAVEDSEIRKSNPDQFAQLAQKVFEGSGIGTVRLEAKVLQDIFNSATPPTAFTEASFFSLIKSADFAEYQRALASDKGGDIVLEMGDYAAHITGTDLDRAVSGSLRLEAADLTQEEAKDAEEKAEARVDAQLEALSDDPQEKKEDIGDNPFADVIDLTPLDDQMGFDGLFDDPEEAALDTESARALARDAERKANEANARVLNDERERLVQEVMNARGLPRSVAEYQVEPLVSFAQTMARRHKLPVADYLARFPLPLIENETSYDPGSPSYPIDIDAAIVETTTHATMDEATARQYQKDFPAKHRLTSRIRQVAGENAITQDHVIEAVASLRREGFTFFDVDKSIRETRATEPSLVSRATDRVAPPVETTENRDNIQYSKGLKVTEDHTAEFVIYGNTPEQVVTSENILGANEGDANSGAVKSGGFRKVVRIDPAAILTPEDRVDFVKDLDPNLTGDELVRAARSQGYVGMSFENPDGSQVKANLFGNTRTHQVVPTDAATASEFDKSLKRFRADHRMEERFLRTFFKDSKVTDPSTRTPRVAQRVIDGQWNPLTLYSTTGVQPGFGQDVEQVFMRVSNPLRLSSATLDADLLPALHNKLEQLREEAERADILTGEKRYLFNQIANKDGDTGVEDRIAQWLIALGYDGIGVGSRYAAFDRDQFQPITEMESDTQSEASYGDHYLPAGAFIELFGKTAKVSDLPKFKTLKEVALAARTRLVQERPNEQAAHELADSLVAASEDYAGFAKLLSEAQSGNHSVRDAATLFEVYAGRRELVAAHEVLKPPVEHPSLYSALEYAWADMFEGRKESLTRSERKELRDIVNAAGEIAIQGHRDTDTDTFPRIIGALVPGSPETSALVRTALQHLRNRFAAQKQYVSQTESTARIKTADDLDTKIRAAFTSRKRGNSDDSNVLDDIRNRYDTLRRRKGPDTTDKTWLALKIAIGDLQSRVNLIPEFLKDVDTLYQDTEFLLQPYHEQGATRVGEYEALPLGLEDQKADGRYDSILFDMVHSDHMKRVLEIIKTKFPGAEITNEETTSKSGDIHFSGGIHDGDANRTTLYNVSRSYNLAMKSVTAHVVVEKDELKGLGIGADWLSALALFFERMSDNTGVKHNMSTMDDGVLVWLLKGYVPAENERVWDVLMKALETDNREVVRAAITDGSIKKHADAIKRAFTDANINTWYSATTADRVIELHANPSITANETLLFSVKDDRSLIREARKADPLPEEKPVEAKTDVDIVGEHIKLVEDGAIFMPFTIPETERRLAWVEETPLRIEDPFYAGYTLDSQTNKLIPPTAPPTFYIDADLFDGYDYNSGDLLRIQEQRFAPKPVVQVSIRGRFVRQTDLRDYVKGVRGVSDLNLDTITQLVEAGVSGVTHDVGNALNLILFDPNNAQVFESEADGLAELTGDRRIHRDEQQFTPVEDRIPYGLRSAMSGRTQEFGKWFYKSVVRRSDGSPMLVDGPLGLLRHYKEATEDTQAGRYVSIQRPKRIKTPAYGLAGVLRGAKVDLNIDTESDYRAFLKEIGADHEIKLPEDTDFSAKSMLEAYDHAIYTRPHLEAFIRGRLLPMLLSKFTEKGFDGFVHTDERGDTTYIPFDGAQVKTASNPEIWLYQPASDGRLGGVPQSPTGVKGLTRIFRDPADVATPVIHLFESADLSTLLHETAHYMDITLDKLAASGSKYAIEERKLVNGWLLSNASTLAASAGMEVNQIVEYINSGKAGRESEQANHKAIREHLHEAIAEGFEKYLREGKAPSVGLARVFETFARWLTAIYRHLRNLGRTGVILDPQIRGVFDRMLAADDEIRDRQTAGSHAHMGMVSEIDLDPHERAELQNIHDGVLDEARQVLRNRMLQDHEDVKKGLGSEVEARVRAEETERINNRPINRVATWLAYESTEMEKKWVPTKAAPRPPDDLYADLKLDVDDLIASYGEEMLPHISMKQSRDSQGRLRRPIPLYTKDTGIQADDISNLFSNLVNEDVNNPAFLDGADVIQRLRLLPDIPTQINAAVRMRMTLAHDPESEALNLEEEADDAMVNRRRADMIVAEFRYINRLANKDGSPTFRQEAREAAAKDMESIKVREAIQSHVYRALEARHSNTALKHVINKDYDEAIKSKKAQMVQFELFMQSRALRAEKEKMDRLVRRLKNKKTYKNLQPDPLMTPAIREIIYNVDLSVNTLDPVARQTALPRLVEHAVENGYANKLDIQASVERRRKRQDPLDLSPQALRDTHRTMKNLMHVMRNNKRIRVAGETADRDKIIEALVIKADDSFKTKKLDRVRNPKEKKWDSLSDMYNLVEKADTTLMRFDNLEANEVFYRTFKADIDKAGIVAQNMREHASKELNRIFGTFTAKEKIEYSQRKLWDGSKSMMSKFDIISIALNTGNIQNYYRLTDPNNRPTAKEIEDAKRKDVPVTKEALSFTENEVRDLVSVLNERDWTLVQEVWDFFEREFWPKIYERETRLTGLAPEKVEASPMVDPGIAGLDIRGGYYPVVYDPDRTANVGDDTNRELAEALMTGRYGKAQTRNGHTKERLKGPGGKVLFVGIEALFTHTNRVIHDLAFGEPVAQTWRMLQNGKVRKIFEDKGKLRALRSLEVWAQDVAAGPAGGTHIGAGAVRMVKNGFVTSKLAFNLLTALSQFTGVLQTAALIGKRNTAMGYYELSGQFRKRVSGNKDALVVESDFMRKRQETFNRDLLDIMMEMQISPLASVKQRAQWNMQQAGFFTMQKVQYYIVDLATWYGARRQAQKLGLDRDAQIAHADRMVAQGQASGLYADRSAIERGTLGLYNRQNEFVRLFTALMSYTLAKMNVSRITLGRAARDWTKGERNKIRVGLTALFDLFMLFALEGSLYALLSQGLPEFEDDESWLKQSGQFVAAQSVLTFLSGIPFVKDFASVVQGYPGGGSYGSILETFGRTYSAGEDVVSDLVNEGELGHDATVQDLRPVLDVAGLLLPGLPSTQSWRIFSGMGLTGEEPSWAGVILGR